MPLVITADSTRADLEMAINHLNAKRQQCEDPAEWEELTEDIHQCLDAWPTAPIAPEVPC